LTQCWCPDKQAEEWISLVSALSDEELQGDFTYRDTRGHDLTRVRGEVLDHVFNQYECPQPDV
jgi:hypothetical protein